MEKDEALHKIAVILSSLDIYYFYTICSILEKWLTITNWSKSICIKGRRGVLCEN